MEAGGFLEWVQFLDYRQGSPVPTPPPGCDVLFEIDVAGARMVRERWPQAICVFIDAPSRAVQEERLRGRGDDDARIVQRLAKAEEEVAAALEMGAHIVINDDLDTTVNELQRLIERARAEAAGTPR
jgi:guanylate kinase